MLSKKNEKTGEKLYWMSYCVEEDLRKKGVQLENYKEKYAYHIFCEDCVKEIFPESVIDDVTKDEDECEVRVVNKTWDQF